VSSFLAVSIGIANNFCNAKVDPVYKNIRGSRTDIKQKHHTFRAAFFSYHAGTHEKNYPAASQPSTPATHYLRHLEASSRQAS
jgi:hypothetical protein